MRDDIFFLIFMVGHNFSSQKLITRTSIKQWQKYITIITTNEVYINHCISIVDYIIINIKYRAWYSFVVSHEYCYMYWTIVLRLRDNYATCDIFDSWAWYSFVTFRAQGAGQMVRGVMIDNNASWYTPFNSLIPL